MKLQRVYSIISIVICTMTIMINARTRSVVWPNNNPLSVRMYNGPQAAAFFDAIAAMRMMLFAEFPYLYDGNLAYEREYLTTYFNCSDASIILVLDGNNVVGFSSSIPLEHECPEIREPFHDGIVPLNKYLYIGEVMLLPAYRGRGILRMFFELHERKARQLHLTHAAFMTVDRPADHPLRPLSYKDLDPIWQHFGYAHDDDRTIFMSWPQVDTGGDTVNPLSIWTKEIACS